MLQLLTEGLLIAVAAGMPGARPGRVIVQAGLAIFFLTLPPSFAAVARVLPLDFDYRVFAFALVVAGLDDADVRAGAGAAGTRGRR